MKRTFARILVLTAMALTAVGPAVASAQSIDGWAEYREFGSSYLCQAAGVAGEWAGQWDRTEWMCLQSTLVVKESAAGMLP